MHVLQAGDRGEAPLFGLALSRQSDGRKQLKFRCSNVVEK
ncbi:hypothetical protein N181_28290 [Sinorhizobium fredii USDA 205]|nr:hypothetical protein SF83666_b67300 [Sinorhizobium fredii CCBAU 83666]AWM27561.1 hypothetical protein AOX55_00004782 [Sinorhizobium fredii CCBAU 25509]KSV81140.1 hypothetical protein N181_28290 [Sinorhizobium fredii USDA 205]